MKKKLSLLLALLMAASTLSCANDTVETEETETTPSQESESTVPEKETTPYINDSLDEQNFNGYEFRIHQSRAAGEYVVADEYTGVPVNDVLFESKCNVENRFNVKITLFEDMTDTTAALEQIRKSINASDNAFDITIGPDFNTFTLGQQGYLYNLYDIEQFDFNMPWWTPDALENLTINGMLFSASNYMSYEGLHWTRAVMVNKDIAEKYNIEIPYDMVREGTWTLDALYNHAAMTVDDTNGDGTLEDGEGIGFTGYSFYTLQVGVGIPVYHNDSEGNLIFDLDMEKIDKYMEYMNKLTAPSIYVNGGNHGADVFNKGKAFLVYCEIGHAYDIFKGSDFYYGFLSTPKLDEYQPDYINCCTDQPWGISATSTEEQREIIGYVCEALSCCNYNNALPVYFDSTMKSRIADEPDDAEMLQLIRDTRTIGLAFAYNLHCNNIYELVTENGGNVASTLARYQKLGQKGVDIFLKSFGGR